MKRILLLMLVLVTLAGCSTNTSTPVTMATPSVIPAATIAVTSTATIPVISPTAQATTSTTVTPAPIVTVNKAQLIKEWSGSGTKNTETFHIDSKAWSISWDNTGSTAVIYIGIFNTTDSKTPIDTITGPAGKADISYFYVTGEFYLNILGGDIWSVKVQTE